MRFHFSWVIPATAAACALLVAVPAWSQAQQPGVDLATAAPQAVTADALPEAPRPQLAVVAASPAAAQGAPAQIDDEAGADAQPATVSGTVVDTNDEIVPGATVVLEGPAAADRRTTLAGDDGAFLFDTLRPGVPYHVTITAKGFVKWVSPPIVCTPGQHTFLTGISIRVEGEATSVTVLGSPQQIAIEQVRIEEQQRVLGIIPNFYVVYDANPAPLNWKLKFSLALKVGTDPIAFLGAGFLAGVGQAADSPGYVQGAKGFGQRFGANYVDDFSDILIGGAILPSLLHQDPRYYYQGTGTFRSRAFHALSYAFVCRGDNGKLQPNFSTMGGDLGSALISTLYYPPGDRGTNMVVQNFLVGTMERITSSMIQEFVLRKLTRITGKKEDSPL